jgi:perosamine synthetase
MNDIAAALGRVQLRRLPELILRREQIAHRYEAGFADISELRWVRARPNTAPSWHMFTVLVNRRDEFVERMRQRGVAVGVHYFPLHLYRCSQEYRVRLPITEEVWKRVATLPLYPELTEEDQVHVIRCAIETARELT